MRRVLPLLRSVVTATLGAAILMALLPGPTASAESADRQDRKKKTEPETFDRDRGRLDFRERTGRGDWWGTWFYLSRDYRVAIWMRPDSNGDPELQMQVYGITSAETFTTDWQGHSDYFVRNLPATFDLELEQRGENLITGTWFWDFDVEDSARKETANVELYRTGDGRRLILEFKDYARTIRRGQRVQRYEAKPKWTFYKASKRLIPFDELPF